MPRKPRIFGDDIGYHVILRCNNHERLLHDGEFPYFLNLFQRYRDRFSLKIYDYVLMHSHVHVLLSTHNGYSLDVAMREFCLAFSKQYNNRNERSGHFWRDRYWCRVVSDDRYALACMRYFARNPVQAGLIVRPEQWRWGGCRYYAGIECSGLLEHHPTYLGLGPNALARQRNYLKLIAMPPTKGEKTLFVANSRHMSHRFEKQLGALSNRYLMEVRCS